MRASLVVPRNPTGYCPFRFLEAREIVLPDAFLLQTPEEALDHPVLLRRVGRDKLLLQVIIFACLPKPATLKNKSVVVAENRALPWISQRAESSDTGHLQGSLRLVRSSPERKLVADELSVATIDDRYKMPPSVKTTGNMRHIRRPFAVARCLTTY